MKSTQSGLYRYMSLSGKSRYLGITSIAISPNKRFLGLSGSTNLIYDLKKEEIVDRSGSDSRPIERMLFLADDRFITLRKQRLDSVNFWEFDQR